MKILYHMTNLPPRLPGTEASLQELNVLRHHFGGHLVYLNPNERSPVYLPRLLFGFHQLKRIHREEAGLQLHHLYNADPFPFPFIHWLRRPVIYSVSSGVGSRRPNLAFFRQLAAVTVADERSLRRLQGWGLPNCHLVRPGIDTTRFTCTPLPLQSEFRLLVGSAPWTRRQFQSKGVEALLAVAQELPNLRLVCLWRGLLLDELERRLERLGLQSRVEVINRKVDVNEVLAGVHASITLVTDPAIIRSYPHSLLESLAAGKPVLVSRSIPMSDYVAATGCGQVVEEVTPAAIGTAIEALVRRYGQLQRAAVQVGQRDFTRQELINSFQQVYERILN